MTDYQALAASPVLLQSVAACCREHLRGAFVKHKVRVGLLKAVCC